MNEPKISGPEVAARILALKPAKLDLDPWLRSLGLKRERFYAWQGGVSPEVESVEKWAQAMGVNAQWLAHGDAAIIAVPILGCIAAGGGAWNDSAESRGTVWFDRRTLAALVRGDAVCAEIVGESMEPLILSGDIVLVDRAANVPRKRRGRWRIYAIRESTGEISAKRLVWQRNQWELHSDHPDYAPRKLEYVAGDQSPILGEIVWLCRRLV